MFGYLFKNLPVVLPWSLAAIKYLKYLNVDEKSKTFEKAEKSQKGEEIQMRDEIIKITASFNLK